ncbi:MAG: hypothetical protein KME17_27735 [Cyanosarcina radialis HA8281-LM2]|jgi:hypothetical protein|nr:hypothetical protein [Cyanosarcina radialis HA8281-LM2]
MNYLVAVLADRDRAEAAYTALLEGGITSDRVEIIGKGYKSADEYGSIEPSKPAKQRLIKLIYWLIPFGFIAGYLFNVLTRIEILSVSSLGNHFLGGLLGAIAGILGAIFVVTGVGLTVGSGDALPYRHYLDAGKYIVVVNGSEELTDRAIPILRQFEPENFQGYIEFPQS